MGWPSALIAGGTAFKVFGSLEEGSESKRRYEFEARYLEKQSQLLLAGAEHKLETGKIVQFEMEREKGYALGAMEAGRGKSGIAFTGSAATSSRRMESRYNERNRQFGRKMMFEYGQEKARAQMLLDEARESRRRGKYAKKQSYWGAAGDLLGGGGSILLGRD